MSSDLRHHPVTYFVLPIIEQYDRSRFELYCYSFYKGEADSVQKLIAESVDRFAMPRLLPDPEVASIIAADELDILFELGGTTNANRLEVMAYRPAPVQVSWLGYPHSAGLSTIDYLLVDPYLKPARPELMIEKPFEMPETWVSLGRLGFRDEPIEPGLPEDGAGHITFGTLNSPYKFSAALMALWAAVLQRVDGSHMLFCRPEAGTAAFQRNVAAEFAKHGIAADRLDFIGVRGDHLRHYNRIDIALDTAPHTGGTTTCETLWMGVPAVTLVGDAFFERLAYSNLVNAGLGDLCTFTRDAYVDTAVALAMDRPRRRELRHGLRAQICDHPLGQTERFVANFQTVIERTLASHVSR
jgi:predicted O-linked N-acetylglucosamine transferase (SPINDLY family)